MSKFSKNSKIRESVRKSSFSKNSDFFADLAKRSLKDFYCLWNKKFIKEMTLSSSKGIVLDFYILLKKGRSRQGMFTICLFCLAKPDRKIPKSECRRSLKRWNQKDLPVHRFRKTKRCDHPTSGIPNSSKFFIFYFHIFT